MYRRYETAEEKARVGTHYERPLEFFYPILGGPWHVYSGLVWERATTLADAQQEKLDLLATLMRIERGDRVLDVGCGWGGPLVYLCERYGARGVGLTVAQGQEQGAKARVRRHSVDAVIHHQHWQEYRDGEAFDEIIADESPGHFSDIDAYFRWVHGLLRVGGRALVRDLHFTHSRYAEMSRGMSFINELFGETANYRTLADELKAADGAGLDLVRVAEIDIVHYIRTIDAWRANLREHRGHLQSLVGADDVRRFETYLRLSSRALESGRMTVEVSVFEKRAS